MAAQNRATNSPMVPIIMDDDDDLDLEDYMDKEFGRGMWVRDTWSDACVTYDPHHTGPGIGYLLVDRQRRRRVTVVHKNQVH